MAETVKSPKQATRNCSFPKYIMKIMILIFSILNILFNLSPKSFADTEIHYVTWSCNEADKTLIITTPVMSDDDPPPPHSVPLADVGRGPPPNRPVEVCNLGPRRIVKIRGLVNDDHPRNNHLEITIGERPPIDVFETNETIKIHYKSEDFFVSLQKCDSKFQCTTRDYTNPSSNCGPDKIDMFICDYDELSVLDVSLAATWRASLNKFKESDPFRNRLKKEESDWLSSRGLACGIPGRPGVSPDLIVGCLVCLYKSRIIQLGSELQSIR